MANHVMRLDDETKGGGDTLHIPQFTELTAGNKSAGSALTPSANTEGKIDLSIDQHKATAVLIEDIAKVQASYDLRSLLTKEIGRSVAQAVDDSLMALESGLSQSVTGGTALEDSEVISAVEFLDNSDTPMEDRYWVVDAAGMADLRALATFTRYDSTGSNSPATGANKGLVANVFGVDVLLSNNVVTSGTTTVTHNSVMFHKEAFILAKQKDISVKADYSVLDVGWELAADCIYGVTEYRDTSAVKVTYTTS